MMMTSFNQNINGTSYTITVPMTRVVKLLDRVDAFSDARRYKKAYAAIKPFITEQTSAPKKISAQPATIIEQYRSEGRKVVHTKLLEAGFTGPSGYYHMKKAGL